MLSLYGCSTPKPALPQTVQIVKHASLPQFSYTSLPQDDLKLLQTQNYDLQKSELILEKNAAFYQKSYGILLPQLDASLLANRTRNANGDKNNADYKNGFGFGGRVIFNIDPFGRLKALKKAEENNYIASFYDRQALSITIASAYLKNYHNLIFAQKIFVLSEKMQDIALKNTRISDIHYQSGISSVTDVLTAKQNLASAQVNTQNSLRSIALAGSAYNILLGKKPETTLRTGDFVALPSVIDLNNIPLQIIDNRPDITAMRHRLEANLKIVDASLAALYPDMSLSLDIASATSNLKNILSLDYIITTIGGQISQTLFDGGRNKADIKIAKADAKIARLDYKNTIIQALNDISTKVTAFKNDQEAYHHAKDNQIFAKQALASATRGYENGQISLTQLLDTQKRFFEAQNTYIANEKLLRDDYTDLLVSLGITPFDMNFAE